MKIVYLKVLSLKRSLPCEVMAFIIWSQLSMGLVQHWKSDTLYCKPSRPIKSKPEEQSPVWLFLNKVLMLREQTKSQQREWEIIGWEDMSFLDLKSL